MVMTDPTTRRDGDNIKKAGKYVNWIIKQFLQIEPNIEASYGTPQFKKEFKEKTDLFFEDLYKTTDDLIKFDRFKSQIDDELRDINKLTIDNGNFSILGGYSIKIYSITCCSTCKRINTRCCINIKMTIVIYKLVVKSVVEWMNSCI